MYENAYDPPDDNDSDKDDGYWTDYGLDGRGPTGSGPITYDSSGNIVPQNTTPDD